MIRILLLLMTFAGVAQAETLPALHDVTGVSAGDVLNVRAEPSASAPVIATLARDASGIEVVERRGNWGLVNAGEAAGWAYLKYLAPRAEAPWFRVTSTLRCFGTEPFWSLTLAPGAGDVRREEPGLPETRLKLGAISSTERGASIAFGAEGQPGGDLLLTGARCSDGMSDRQFGITVTGTLRPGLSGAAEPAALQGCCSVKP
ncbi:MAG: SH3 domain-containing protein [Gemmobacter sp.]|uniref:SH3 domain-containing protein n=1 Tax=Gemmobacter sp. TaxID=1898957 RepID=UPI001A5277DC|nr:SH3 domain-containing protein [Gemmobacter sp.]MBL8562916.1 SH3 domain-containing protein [Gemmobacter sp.]